MNMEFIQFIAGPIWGGFCKLIGTWLIGKCTQFTTRCCVKAALLKKSMCAISFIKEVLHLIYYVPWNWKGTEFSPKTFA